MEFKDLTHMQKLLVGSIERIYIMNEKVTTYDFIKALAFVLNKYKRMGGKK